MRKHADWLAAFIDYASYGEAPIHMLFWVGVSTIAGALRRKVWIDQTYFRWYPNFYIILVAPPGIVSKTTTVSLGTRLLKEVPDVKFGPNITTWPSLVEKFAEAKLLVPMPGTEDYMPMCALTLESGELGNLIDPQDKQMIDLMVALWDGQEGTFDKTTKSSGSDSIENPWINLIGCTTPAWIAGNFPEYMIGGGFTSRTIFVYAEKKRQMVAYPSDHVPANIKEKQADLLHDLVRISELCGEMKISPDAKAWGKQWYDRHYSQRTTHLDMERFGGYVARKQTHIHKLAMVLSAAQGSDMWITADHLRDAEQMVTDLEPDLFFVFNKIGRSTSSLYAEKLISFVHSRGEVSYVEAYRQIHAFFPSIREFEDVLLGCIRSGYIKQFHKKDGPWLSAGAALPQATNGTSPPMPVSPPVAGAA